MKKKRVVKCKDQLISVIQSEMSKYGKNCDLNHIDISKVRDLSSLFGYSDFNGDISQWDTSHVFSMEHMFYKSSFNGNITNWDVSNVRYMEYMFVESDFKGDLSNWYPYKLERICVFDGAICPIPYWANYEDINERVNAINRYRLEKGIVKELNEELTNNLKIKERKIKV